MKKCTSCGQTYEEDINFCPQCGGAVEKVIETVEEPKAVCPNCNAIINNSGAAFCPFCGASLAEEPVQEEEETEKYCPNCNAIIEDENAAFCVSCGASLIEKSAQEEETEKHCPICNVIIEDENAAFCVSCGASLAEKPVQEEEVEKRCPNCNAIMEDENALFCYLCGAKIQNDIPKQVESFQNVVKNVTDKVKENDFVKSVKQDFENSQSLNIIKDKAKEGFNSAVDIAKGASENVRAMDPAKKKTTGIIAAVIAAVFVIVVFATNIHTCEECGKTFFGKQYSISFFGLTEKTCKDCYEDFYSFW